MSGRILPLTMATPPRVGSPLEGDFVRHLLTDALLLGSDLPHGFLAAVTCHGVGALSLSRAAPAKTRCTSSSAHTAGIAGVGIGLAVC